MTDRAYYHIFGDSWDRYSKSKKEAKKIFNQEQEKGYTNIRLYKQISENEEEYVLGIGDFPQ